jgi:hypothetical protein
MEHENYRMICNVVCYILTSKILKILNVVKYLLKQKVSSTCHQTRDYNSNLRQTFFCTVLECTRYIALIFVLRFIFKVPLPALTNLLTVSSKLLSTPSWPLHTKKMKDFPSLYHCPNYISLSCMSY